MNDNKNKTLGYKLAALTISVGIIGLNTLFMGLIIKILFWMF